MNKIYIHDLGDLVNYLKESKIVMSPAAQVFCQLQFYSMTAAASVFFFYSVRLYSVCCNTISISNVCSIPAVLVFLSKFICPNKIFFYLAVNVCLQVAMLICIVELFDLNSKICMFLIRHIGTQIRLHSSDLDYVTKHLESTNVHAI